MVDRMGIPALLMGAWEPPKEPSGPRAGKKDENRELENYIFIMKFDLFSKLKRDQSLYLSILGYLFAAASAQSDELDALLQRVVRLLHHQLFQAEN